ncbi:MAG: cyclic nucleotide-binding domain-containing protein, partial [Pelobium sp.]
MNDKLAFLKETTPFNLLPEEVLTGIAELLQEVKHKKDTLLYQQEITKMRGVDIIHTGSYESFFYDGNEEKRDVENLERGNSYGGISVLLNKKRSLKTVIAKKGTVIYFLHRKDFRSLCVAYEDFFQHYTS